MITRAGALLIAGAALSFAAAAPDAFLTAPQRDTQLEPIVSATADVSNDGRFVAFESFARLVAADTNTHRDVYVLDLDSRQVTLESGALPSQTSTRHPRLSGDGRFLVLESTELRSDGERPRSEIILSDRSTGASRVVSRALDGELANGSSRDPDISVDGQAIVFTSDATNLVAGPDSNGVAADIYVLDLRIRALQRISVDSSGVQPSEGSSHSPSISGDGQRVAFASFAPLVSIASSAGPHRATAHKQVYVRDLAARTTMLASTGNRMALADGDSWAPALSDDGRLVAFVSRAGNLGGVGRERSSHVFLRDLHARTTTLISRAASGRAASGTSAAPSISGDGRLVAFHSDAPNLVCSTRCPPGGADINLVADVFVLDRTTSIITRVTRDQGGEWMEASRGAALDGSGRVLAFASRHPVDALDTGDDFDLFVKVAR